MPVNERGRVELGMLQAWFEGLEYLPAGDWVILRNYDLGEGWFPERVDVAFQIPANLPGQAPYAFYVSQPVTFRGQQPVNYTYPLPPGTVPFAGAWAQFSWAPELWTPAQDALAGDNMVHFAQSIASRLQEGA
jgi:hypothetical protein